MSTDPPLVIPPAVRRRYLANRLAWAAMYAGISVIVVGIAGHALGLWRFGSPVVGMATATTMLGAVAESWLRPHAEAYRHMVAQIREGAAR